jgi:tetratricopeptide (TPR) repeat protein
VFAASPSDVAEHREALREVIHDLNENVASDRGLVLEFVTWANVSGDMGRAEQIILDQIGEFDVFIGIMGRRFGTATGKYNAGTEEEFHTAYNRWEKYRTPRILFYFRVGNVPAPDTAEEVRQLHKVLKFRRAVAKRGLVTKYKTKQELVNLVRRDLTKALYDIDNSAIGTGSTKAETPASAGDYQDIQIPPPANETAALHQLRAPVGDFVGREQQIESLISALRRDDSRVRVASISGMGGIGKTELALLVASRLIGDYPDAQFFINLKGTDPNPLSQQEVMAACIRAFLHAGASLPEDLDQLSKLYRSQLNRKHVLLLLDNAADSAQVRHLIPPTGCAMLVTSQQAITVAGMTLFPLNPLPPEQAQKLLLKIAPRTKAAAKKICELCDYLPLAIRATGSLLNITPDLSPATYANQLKNERKRLERIGEEGVEIGVEASFNLSYARLSPEAARVFRLLSVFPSSFDAAAEEAVCADSNHEQLTDLLKRSLVLYDSSTNRYRLLDLTRLFADAKLREGDRRVGQKQFTMRRHAEYFLATAEIVEPQLGGTELRKHMEWFKAEQDNMRAALSWCLEHDAEMALRFAYSLSSFWNMLGQLSEERQALNDALLAATTGLAKRWMRALGRAAVRQFSLKQAKSYAETHLELSRLTKDLWEETWALQNLGRIAQAQGRLAEARELHEKALKLFQRLKDQRGMAMTLLNLCVVALDQEELDSARTFATKSLKLCKQVGDRGDLPIAGSYLAFLLHRDGKEVEAEKLISESVEMLRMDERQSWLPWGLHWKGRIEIGRGDFKTAYDSQTESLTRFQTNQDIDGKIRSLLAFSWLCARKKLWERAATLLAAEVAQRSQQHLPTAPDWRREIKFINTGARRSLGHTAYEKACTAGKRMTLDQAVAYALRTI